MESIAPGTLTKPTETEKVIFERQTLYNKLLIPPSEQVQLAIIIGYGDETPELHKRIQDNILFID